MTTTYKWENLVELEQRGWGGLDCPPTPLLSFLPIPCTQSLTLAWVTHAPPPFRESCLHHLHQGIYQA